MVKWLSPRSEDGLFDELKKAAAERRLTVILMERPSGAGKTIETAIRARRVIVETSKLDIGFLATERELSILS
jgi:hypothetical protein